MYFKSKYPKTTCDPCDGRQRCPKAWDWRRLHPQSARSFPAPDRDDNYSIAGKTHQLESESYIFLLGDARIGRVKDIIIWFHLFIYSVLVDSPDCWHVSCQQLGERNLKSSFHTIWLHFPISFSYTNVWFWNADTNYQKLR